MRRLRSLLFYPVLIVLLFSLFNLFAGSANAQSCGGGTVYHGNKVKTCQDGNGNTCPAPGPNCTCNSSCPFGHGGQETEFCSDQGNCSACVNMQGTGECGSGSCNWGGVTSCPSSCSGGSYCNGNSASGSPIGTYVCGGGNINYRCLSNGTWSSQATSCTLCTPTTITTSSCSYPSNSSSIAWSATTGAEYYALRINDSSVAGWNGTCSSANANQGNFCSNITSPTTSYSWTGVAGHSYTWWVHACDSQTGCSASVQSSFVCATATPTPTATNTPTPTPTNTPTPTPTPVIFSYYKMKDTSFYKIGSLSQNFPPVYSAFDSDDTSTGGYFNQGQAGSVISSGSTLSAGAGGTAISGSSGSPRNWTAINYSGGSPFTSASFIDYVKAKKNMTAVNTIGDLPTSGSGGTYSVTSTTPITLSGTQTFRSNITILVNTNLTISTSDIGKDNVVFLVDGDVTINGSGTPATFNAGKRGFAVISTGTINFANALTEADGLFVANSVNFGTGANALKIIGNVSSATAATLSRDRATNQPSMFIMYDPRHYQSVIDRISTVKSSWTQLQ